VIRTTAALAALLAVTVACSQPTADDMPDGVVPVVPAVRATDLDIAQDAQFVKVTPRTPVGRIVDHAIRGARAAEIVAQVGRTAPVGYLPACTTEGDVVVIVDADVDLDEVTEVIYDAVRQLDFLDVTEAEVFVAGQVADLTCVFEDRPLP
jgi:hypothetical protein